MDRFRDGVIKHRKAILLGVLVVSIICAYLMTFVNIEYDLSSYLPKNAPTSRALLVLGDQQVPNLRTYIPNITPREALVVKQQLSDIDGVQDVLWLDDMLDIQTLPWEMIPESARAPYYQNGGALYQMSVAQGEAEGVLQHIRDTWPGTLFQGDAANSARLSGVSMGEIASIMYYVLPLVLLILLVSTRHWFEPILFLITIGVAIVINEGTNIFLGSVSFVTQACSAVLQLAVSIDYAVFLLHKFDHLRAQGVEPETAMKQTMKTEASTIAASAMTTVFGFLVLVFMDFTIGMDMGIVLAKGVLLSYLSVMIFLPALAMASIKIIDKTAHRNLMPSFKRFGKVVIKRGLPLGLVVLLLVPIAFMGQQRNNFLYGTAGMHAEDSPVKQEARAVDAIFGRSLPMLLLVPGGQPGTLNELTNTLSELPGITAVISYSTMAGSQIPREVLPDAATSQLSQGEYDRIILNADTNDEGPEAFALVEAVRVAAQAVVGDNYHLIGESVVNYDLKESITGDSLEVLLLGILAIGMVLLLTFKNALLPFVLLIVLEGAIWINMSIPYFFGSDLNYVGYQIVSSVQLGATIDYAILLTQRYIEARRELPKRQAAAQALSRATGSILPPASILTIAGYMLSIVVTSNGIISQMGEIIGRGALMSAIMVLLVLPQVLTWVDKPIQKAFFGKTREEFVK